MPPPYGGGGITINHSRLETSVTARIRFFTGLAPFLPSSVKALKGKIAD